MSTKSTKAATDKSAKPAKAEKYLKEEPLDAKVDAVLCEDPTKGTKKKVLAHVRITFTRPGLSSTTSVYLREAHEKWTGSHTLKFLQSQEGTDLLVNNFDTKARRKALGNALLMEHGTFALSNFFLCTTQGFEVLMEALKSEDGRKIIRETLKDVVAEANQSKKTEAQNTEGGPDLQPSGLDDSLEILQVVPPPADGALKPAAKVKPEPTTPSLSSKPPIPKTGNVSGQKRKTRSSDTHDDDDDEDSEDTHSATTINILVCDVVGQWKSRDALVDAELKKRKVSVDGTYAEIDLFLATLGEHRKYSRLLKPFDKTKPVSASNPTNKDLALEAYVKDFKNRMMKKNPWQSFLREYLDANVTVHTHGDLVRAYAAALQQVRIDCPRNNRS
jgi:hypothetical protein